jgi:hypothetical protein
MGITIDLYEFKESLIWYDEEIVDWLHSNGSEKCAYVVTVGEDGMPEELAEELRKQEVDGERIKDGDAVMVIIQ